MREYALSLGRELSERALKVIDGMDSERKVYQYCLQFPMAKPTPVAKKAAPKVVKPVVAEEEE